MTAIININVDDLDTRFLEEIRDKYRGAHLEIKINYDKQSAEEENWFWEVIDMLDWSKEGDDDLII